MPYDNDLDERPGSQGQIPRVLAKLLVVALTVGALIGLGTWILVRALDLDDPGTTTLGPPVAGPVSPLPTTALPVPSESDLPTPDGVVTTTAPPDTTDLYLNASPVFVKPMERINFTGQWPGHDNEGLLVQRKEDGKWTDFGVQATVRVGTYETYIMTGRPGDNQFRMYSPSEDAASNVVTITVG